MQAPPRPGARGRCYEPGAEPEAHLTPRLRGGGCRRELPDRGPGGRAFVSPDGAFCRDRRTESPIDPNQMRPEEAGGSDLAPEGRSAPAHLLCLVLDDEPLLRFSGAAPRADPGKPCLPNISTHTDHLRTLFRCSWE